MSLQMRQDFELWSSGQAHILGCCWLEVKCVWGAHTFCLEERIAFVQDPEKKGLAHSPPHLSLTENWRSERKAGCFSSHPESSISPCTAVAMHPSGTSVMGTPHLSGPGTLKGTFSSAPFSSKCVIMKSKSCLCYFFPSVLLGVSDSCGHNSLISMIFFEGLLQMKQGAWFC